MAEPLIISTWSFGQRGHRAAWAGLMAGGSSLDAVEQACCAVEADPEVDSVGYGGLPDRDGRVTLDASIMLSPSQCGSVCAVGRYLPVTSIARKVMEKTCHVMLAGSGAEGFAAEQGFVKTDLVHPGARSKWEAWKANPARSAHAHGKDSGLAAGRPVDADGSGQLFHHTGHDESRWDGHDTIGTLAIDRAGVMAGACSTSGTAYKAPGRVGDSPIIGAGLYVDPNVGAATATGSGELVMGVCGAFLIVELMRQGATPLAATRDVLHRINSTYEIRPEHQVGFVAIDPQGRTGSGALRPGFRVALQTEDRDEINEPDLVLRHD